MGIMQNISARCVHYLDEMGISLQVWVQGDGPHRLHSRARSG
jgi:hypothetical protein